LHTLAASRSTAHRWSTSQHPQRGHNAPTTASRGGTACRPKRDCAKVTLCCASVFNLIPWRKKMKELTNLECVMIAGGDRNLGSLYQYTGNEGDRTTDERIGDMIDQVLKKLSDAFEQGWH
jgi:hypothetical protein